MRLLFFLFTFSFLGAVQIQLGEEILQVKLAQNHTARSRGLMGQKSLPDGEGMLFVYPKAEYLSFWMKNTTIPLSIAFFDENKTLLNLADMDPPQNERDPLILYQSDGPAQYALEVPRGWFAKHQIGPGAKFSFLDPSN